MIEHGSVAGIAQASSRFPLPAGFKPSYGTAGFRAEASLLESTLFRVGLLTAARSLVLKKHCGIMITASHNPEHDNGVKIVEPSGEMLTQAWEPLATELACAKDDSQVAALMHRLLEQHGVDTQGTDGSPPVAVLLGWDTRPSAGALVAAATAGVSALKGVTPVHLGCVTTPQLHFQVAALNAGQLTWVPPPRDSSTEEQTSNGTAEKAGGAAGGSGSIMSLDLYYDTLLGAFERLIAGSKGDSQSASTSGPLYVDCANGVGSAMLARVSERLRSSSSTGGGLLDMQLINTGDGGLNHKCGADYVQKERVAPARFEGVDPAQRCCSIDGDADRLVYFQLSGAPGTAGTSAPRPVALLDGDKIAALAACLVKDLVAQLPEQDRQGIKVGVVQTAYANGASTAYLTQTLGLEVACAKTGVKHLHEVAHAMFDIGIYFEANGHGTVLFSHSLLEWLRKLAPSSPAAGELVGVSEMVNQSVGDALSCILLVEAALRRQGLSVSGWQSLYTDLPSRQSKVAVKDRSVIVTTDAERRCVAPPGLQEAVDAVVAGAGPQARAFVRPSGTEDIVRVYSEAATQEAADALAHRVAQAVKEFAGGI